MRIRPRSSIVLALAAAFGLGGCGAGLITGVAAGSGGNSTPAARTPSIGVVQIPPLVPADNTTRAVVVTNAQVTPSSQFVVRLTAAQTTVEQPVVSAVTQGESTTITYVVDTARIRLGLTELANDVPATLGVSVDGKEIPAIATVLAGQPQATLDAGPQQQLSPFGQEVTLAMTGLRTADLQTLQVFVQTRDPSQEVPVPPQRALVTRPCTVLPNQEPPDNGVQHVVVVVPGSAFPVAADFFVVDPIAGLSTVAMGAFYSPDVALALPGQGPTTGGSLVTLVGTALVPYDFTSVGSAPPPHFEAVRLTFTKGGRVITYDHEDIRTAESSRDRLVFPMPASPDGRPGVVDVRLTVDLDGTPVSVAASDVFLYANPQPFFGPRGTTLEQLPVAVASIALDGAPGGDDAPDFAALYDHGGVAFLQLLLAQENGMFTRFAVPRQIANHERLEELGPRDLCTGDFDRDGVPDMFVINAGMGSAVHHLVLGQAKPLPPLGGVHRFTGSPGMWRCRAVDFDGDGRSDILLVPGEGAPPGQRPEIWMSQSPASGVPTFAPPQPLDVRDMTYEALDLDDFDGDGHLDIAFVSGTTLRLDIAFGAGNGTFGTVVNVDFAVPGYTADVESPAVGLHGCRNGPQQSIGVVLAGLETDPVATGPTRPTVAVLHQPTPRTFLSPSPVDVEVIPTEPLALSLAADLDQSNTLEMALAVRGDPQFVSLGLLRFGTTRFQPVQGGIELGAESPRQIRALHFDRAFPATPQSGEAKAVFVVHESEIDGGRERRLSTRLLYSDPTSQQLTLLPPDAGAQIITPIEGLVGGNFHPISVAGEGRVRDLAHARAGVIELLENDGFGGFPRPSTRMVWAGLMPRSMRLLPATQPVVERLVFTNVDSRLGIWLHSLTGSGSIDSTGGNPQVPTHVSSELRLASPNPNLLAANLSDRTQIVRGDVDGDGVDDLVVLLCFDLPQPGENDALIALLRGKAMPSSTEFPFFEPTVLTPVHGNASSLALGDFAAASAGPVRLELAVAVPRGTGALSGNHVRFFRYVQGTIPAGDHFVPSARTNGPQVLLAGVGPTRLAAADFDRDDLVDLLVASADDSSLRLFRNVSLPGTGSDVAVGSFVEGLGSPRPLAPGTPTELRLGDVNGDGRLDAIAAVEWLSAANERSTSVFFYLSTGAGEFTTPNFISPTRVGDRDARLSLDLGDWNRDGVLDLFLGWDTFGSSDRNVRVLFGGTR